MDWSLSVRFNPHTRRIHPPHTHSGGYTHVVKAVRVLGEIWAYSAVSSLGSRKPTLTFIRTLDRWSGPWTQNWIPLLHNHLASLRYANRDYSGSKKTCVNPSFRFRSTKTYCVLCWSFYFLSLWFSGLHRAAMTLEANIANKHYWTSAKSLASCHVQSFIKCRILVTWHINI